MDKRRLIYIALLVITMAVLACFPLVIKKDSNINLLIIILLYVILASSWNILGGYTGQINLGHAAFFGIGSLTTRYLWTEGLPFLPCFLAGGIAAIVLALVIGFPAFKLRGVYFAIGTLALAQILNATVGNVLPEMSYTQLSRIINSSLDIISFWP